MDIDDPSQDLLSAALDRFGRTPVITRTGRGGHHLYFRGHPSIRPHDFRHSDGVPQELKTDGNIILLPPSRNHSTGGEYAFVSGSLDDMTALPVIDVRSLPQLDVRAKAQGRPLNETYRRVVALGERNAWLFGQCLRAAHHVDDLDALTDVARTRADEHFGEPMTDAEVVRTARSAWGYQERGENWAGGPARLTVSLDGLRRLQVHGSDACVLALYLRLEHGARSSRGEPFALATFAMAAAGVVPGWSRRQYRMAIDRLLDAGILAQERVGTGRGNPSLYSLRLNAFG